MARPPSPVGCGGLGANLPPRMHWRQIAYLTPTYRAEIFQISKWNLHNRGQTIKNHWPADYDGQSAQMQNCGIGLLNRSFRDDGQVGQHGIYTKY
jgi:hypothetical protein